MSAALNLEIAVERVGVCGLWGAGQGITTRNGCSIPRSYNAAMRPINRAIQHVADSSKWVNPVVRETNLASCGVNTSMERSTAVSRLIHSTGFVRRVTYRKTYLELL